MDIFIRQQVFDAKKELVLRIPLFTPGNHPGWSAGAVPPALRGMGEENENAPLSLELVKRQRRKNLCGTTLVPGKIPALDLALSGEPGAAYFFVQRTARRGYLRRSHYCLAPNGSSLECGIGGAWPRHRFGILVGVAVIRKITCQCPSWPPGWRRSRRPQRRCRWWSWGRGWGCWRS